MIAVRRTKAGALTERVARLLFGAPSGVDSEKGQLRFGDISVNFVTGRFFDCDDEASGNHIELIQRVKNLHNGEAEAWFKDNVTDAKPPPLPAESATERALIGVLAAQPQLMAAIEEDVTADHLAEIIHKEMFMAIARWSATVSGASQPISMRALMDAAGGDPLLPVFDGVPLAVYVARIIAEAPNVPPDAAHFARTLATQIRTVANREGGVADEHDVEPEPPPFVPTMGLRMWHEQDRSGPQYEYLIDDLIPERQVVVVMGETGTGKSFLAFTMAMAIARGVPFFGRRILKPMGVIWCAYEAAEGAAARMRVYRKFHGLTLDPLPFGALEHPLAIWPLGPNNEALVKEIKGIERTRFNGKPLGAIVVDTYNAATLGASEIDSEVVSRIRGCFYRVVAATGATLIIIGHTNAAGRLRGNEQLPNNIDTIIRVSMKTEIDGRENTQLKDKDGREIRTMEVIKQREGERGAKFDFVLHAWDDGTTNKFGNHRTSCVVVQSESTADKEKKTGPKLSPERVVILRALQEAMAEYGEPPPSTLKLPRSITRVVRQENWKKVYLRTIPDDGAKADTISKRLSHASTQFQNLGLIGRINPWVWTTVNVVSDLDLFDRRWNNIK